MSILARIAKLEQMAHPRRLEVWFNEDFGDTDWMVNHESGERRHLADLHAEDDPPGVTRILVTYNQTKG